MSHFVVIQHEAITSLEALDRAAATLSCELVRGQTTLRWAGPRERSDCQHAIRVAKNEEAYEVGLVPAEGQEGWLLIYDDWQGGFGLEAALGKNLSLLLMHYQLERAKLQAEALGYEYEQTQQPDGSITLAVYA